MRNLWLDFIESQVSYTVRCILNSEKLKQEKMGIMESMKTTNPKFLNIEIKGFPGGSAGKESACNAGDLGSIPGLGRSPGEEKGYPLQDSGLENSMDSIVHGLQRVEYDWATFTFTISIYKARHTRKENVTKTNKMYSEGIQLIEFIRYRL